MDWQLSNAVVFCLSEPSSETVPVAWRNWLSSTTAVRLKPSTFPDGEIRLRFPSRPTGGCNLWTDFGLDATGRFSMHTILDVCAAAHAAKQLGANRVRLLTPEIPCMRQDQPNLDVGELAARSLVLSLLRTSGVDIVATTYMKYDVEGAAGLVIRRPGERDVTHAAVESGLLEGVELVVGPDHGSSSLVKEFSRHLNVPSIMLDKRRLSPTSVRSRWHRRAKNRLGPVLIVDDLLVSAGTIATAVENLGPSVANGEVSVFVHRCRPTELGRRRLQLIRSMRTVSKLICTDASSPAEGLSEVPMMGLVEHLLTADDEEFGL